MYNTSDDKNMSSYQKRDDKKVKSRKKRISLTLRTKNTFSNNTRKEFYYLPRVPHKQISQKYGEIGSAENVPRIYSITSVLLCLTRHKRKTSLTK